MWAIARAFHSLTRASNQLTQHFPCFLVILVPVMRAHQPCRAGRRERALPGHLVTLAGTKITDPSITRQIGAR
jgi:hypothetical protein